MSIYARQSSPLAEILAKLLEYTSINSELKPSLRDGISTDEIVSKLKSFPFHIPVEVEELYEWHNGTAPEIGFFKGYSFLPLEDALIIREQWMRCNGDYIVYEPELLPLFEFEGEYYCVECNIEKQNKAPIWRVYHDSSKVYDSLTAMLLALVECYETGAYRPTLKFYDSEHSYIETIIDERKAGEIKLKHNPIRQGIFDYP